MVNIFTMFLFNSIYIQRIKNFDEKMKKKVDLSVNSFVIEKYLLETSMIKNTSQVLKTNNVF